jgi:hypothetical protein
MLQLLTTFFFKKALCTRVLLAVKKVVWLSETERKKEKEWIAQCSVTSA